jgi:F-type H+-transporting ATPase subunit delta
MRDVTIARNYAEALLVLAQRVEDPAAWGRMIAEVGDVIEHDLRVRRFLESPRVSGPTRVAVLQRALQGRFPVPFVRFLQAVIAHRRQLLIPAIAIEYRTLLDEAEGRVHAEVTVARDLDPASRERLAAQLTRALGGGKEVVPELRINAAILGGAIVRIGDVVADGSVRTRLTRLRRQFVASHDGR